MNKKKLVIIYWNLGIGGIQKRIRDMALHVSRNKDDWDVIILIRKSLPEGFNDQIIPKSNLRIETYPFNTRKIRPIGGFFIWILYKYIQLKPNVCLTFLPLLGVSLCLIKKIAFWVKSKLVINEGVVLSEYLALHKLRWLHVLVSKTYKYADHIIVPTLACQNDLTVNFLLNTESISVIPNWTLIKKHKLAKNQLYDVIYVGRFDTEKNVLAICEVAKILINKYSDLKIILIGSGELLSALHSKISNLNIEKNMYIHTFTTRVPDFIYRSKLLILPSLSEGMPNVVLESAMLQVPSITSDFKGSEEVVVHGRTGFIAKNIKELASYVNILLLNDKRRRDMGKFAQKFVSKSFTHTAQAKFLKTLLQT